MRLRVLSWTVANTDPDAPSRPELGSVLAAVDWDVALLRRVPAAYPALLARQLRAEYRQLVALGLPLRGLLARAGLAGGGSGDSAIVARSDRIVAERVVRLHRRPGIRAHGVQLACGLWLANLAGPGGDAADLQAAAEVTLGWAAGAPTMLATALPGAPELSHFTRATGGDADHVFLHGGIDLGAVSEPAAGEAGAMLIDVRLV